MNVHHLFCIATLTAVGAGAQEIGYIEDFSLASKREDVLKKLVPGTDEYFYFQALQAQNSGNPKAFQEMMDRWVRERNGNITSQARELLNRQALLDYGKNPQKSLDYLREQLALQFNHARKTGERRSEAPTKLDAARISSDTLMKRALSIEDNSLNRIEDAGLELVAGQKITPEQRRNLLSRLHRPDYPGLVDLVIADLGYRDSRGVGSHEIHGCLLLAQLDELLKKKPDLRNQSNFVNSYLAKLAPEDEIDLATDAVARAAYFERVWAFAKTLDPVHNSLKANILHGWLHHDQKQGVYNHDRFLEYVKLPRNVHYLRDGIREALPREDHLAQLDQQFDLIELPPIGNDEPLVREYLLRFFAEAANFDEYKPWINDEFLKHVFAEAKITAGVGDPQQWAPLLAPEEYRALKERVDIDFAASNPDVFDGAAAVKLTAFVKNVPSLIVKVYEINTLNYYRETGEPLNLAINLDGLVASSEKRISYPEGSERRVARTFEFPELKGRGTYVVELIGNGKSSRALVQKGRLGVLQEVTAAGHAFTVFDEKNQRLADAHAWLAGREFAPDKDGRLLVPFSTNPGEATLVVSQGGFASIIRFAHLAETYQLQAGLYVDREALIRREKAKLVLRPLLSVNGQPASLGLLEEPRLVIRSVDLQGIATEKEIPGIKLSESGESEHEFVVPDNTVSLTVIFKARIQNISVNQKQDLADSASFSLNGIDRTAAVQDLHVSRTAAGYVVELRGKNGELRPGEPLACAFKHRGFRDEVNLELKTDDQGRLWLGDLAALDRFRIREPLGVEHVWNPLQDACTFPSALQGAADETLRLPAAFAGADPLGDLSLLETRHGQFVKDWRSALSLKDGFVELKGLPAGDYSLFVKSLNREIPVLVTQGETSDGFVMSARRALEHPRLAPLQVTEVKAGADAIEIRLANATPFTRVHLVATRYLPAYNLFAQVGKTGTPGLRQQAWQPARTFYESGRDIGDEYRYILDRQTAKKFPGNMLDRPGLLLNPWSVRDTQAQAEALAGGGGYASASDAFGGAGAPSGAAEQQGREGSVEAGYASLDFLKQPAVTLWNLAPNKDGVIRIQRADLKGQPFLRILATDPVSSVLRLVALDDTPVATRELRQIAGLDPAKTFSEQKIITPVAAKSALVIGDATTARFETCDTIAKAYRILSTLNGNPTFGEFSFITTWPTLEAKEKRRLYSKYACHELSFFLYHKDPEFFKTVILPYLKNKKDKTFLDHWLLGSDLQDYLEPWRFNRLNAVERILLGRRIKEQTASIARDSQDRADLIPPNIEEFNRRFDTALQTGAMDAGSALHGAIDELKKQELAKAEKSMRRMESRELYDAPTPPPPPAPTSLAISRGAKMGGMGGEISMGGMSGMGGMGGMAGGLRGSGELVNKPRVNVLMVDGHVENLERARITANNGTVMKYLRDEKEGRQEAARRFFQKLDPTKEWAENNYYHLPIDQQLAGLVTVNDFWADYAAHDGKTPFLSKSFPQATRNFTEMLLALAVLDLPFEAAKHDEALDGLSYKLTAASPLLVFHREIRAAAKSEQPGTVLIAQHFFNVDDRYRNENNERFDKYVTDEFLPQVVYGAQVVLTNPTANRQKLQVLLQIPMGAIPVANGFYTRGTYVAIEPHGTQKLEYFFYFPATGAYRHYPATIAQNDQVVGGVSPFTFNVVAKLSKIDKTNWAWLSQNGTPEETLAFIDANNVLRLNLNEIAWRMKDREFFKQATTKLTARHLYSDTLWSYGILHNDPETIRAYLGHSPFADRCGLSLVSPLLTLDPVERLDYQHLEFSPLVNPRAHQVGEKRKILNDRFRAQYQRFLTVLSYKPELTATDKLAVAYYLALQDRIAEAIEWYGKVDRKQVPEQLQCDYLEVYLAFSRGDTATARQIAQKHAAEPVDRWRTRFELALAQLDEVEKGVAATAADPENRDQAQGALAATEPSLELQVEAGKIRLDYRNLKTCTLNFYPMDIELLFSRHPFLQDGAAQFSYIRPLLSRTIELPAGKDMQSVDLPAEFKAKNVMVEALGAGARKTQAYYANTLKVQMIENYGQLVVTHADARKPVPGTYVKVYAKLPGGEVKFIKDGYTDLRGRFDYASINTNDADRAERFAILILSDEFGAVVREAEPPKK
jgi:prepilin-type processing-associated H-X9-DG protein